MRLMALGAMSISRPARFFPVANIPSIFEQLHSSIHKDRDFQWFHKSKFNTALVESYNGDTNTLSDLSIATIGVTL